MLELLRVVGCLQNSYAKILTLTVMVLGDDGGTLMNEICVFIKQDTRFFPVFCAVRMQWSYKLGSQPSRDIHPVAP